MKILTWGEFELTDAPSCSISRQYSGIGNDLWHDLRPEVVLIEHGGLEQPPSGGSGWDLVAPAPGTHVLLSVCKCLYLLLFEREVLMCFGDEQGVLL